MKNQIIALLLVLCLVNFTRCSESRQVQKAIKKVENNKAALDQVWAEVRELRPCVPDTIPGTTDTVEIKLPGKLLVKNVPIYIDRGCDIDTLIDGVHVVVSNGALTLQTKSAQGQVITHTTYLKDVEAEKFWRDSTSYYRSTVAAQKAVIHDKEQQIKVLDSDINALSSRVKFLHIKFWGLIVLIVCLFVFKSRIQSIPLLGKLF